MSAGITGLGWVTTSGLHQGRKAGIIDFSSGILPEISRKAAFDEPFPRFGRMDDFSRLGVTAISMALQDAQINCSEQKQSIGLITATVFGCLETDMAYLETARPEGGKLASPHLFAYTLPNAFLGEACIRFGLTGPSFVISEQTQDGLTAVHMGLDLIESGSCRQMICGICDLNSPKEFQDLARVLPGALFILLADKAHIDIEAYGIIDRYAGSKLRINRKPVKDLATLANECLQRYL